MPYFGKEENMYRDMTKGNITKGLLLFALPMIAGNLLLQFYNIADTLIVGQVLGKDALRSAVVHAFLLIFGITLLINVLVYLFLDFILAFLQIPPELYASMREYLLIIFAGLVATFFYNFFSCLLRAIGNSVTPLWFLGISAFLNIGLDLLFVMVLPFGIAGAAAATVIAQYVAGIGLFLYVALKCPDLRPASFRLDNGIIREICSLSLMTCLQQSAMNFGILLVQRLVDSFGPVIMAAFAAGVKIDTFAYLPVQDFGNAFSTFTAQNYGAGETGRLRKGFQKAVLVSAGFSCVLSLLVCLFAHPLMRIFVKAEETAVLAAGVRYLRVEGFFYMGIGCLFLLYGFYRAVNRPGMSVILTVISLGLRVVLAYILSAPFGETGIWAAIPIGWAIADIVGFAYYFRLKRKGIFA